MDWLGKPSVSPMVGMVEGSGGGFRRATMILLEEPLFHPEVLPNICIVVVCNPLLTSGLLAPLSESLFVTSGLDVEVPSAGLLQLEPRSILEASAPLWALPSGASSSARLLHAS